MSMNAFLRVLIGACLFALNPGANAALTCEQLFAVVQEAVRYRDQGYSLSQVLSALKGVEAENQLTKTEADVLRKSVSASYLSQASPEEITLECVNSGKLGKSKNADSPQ